MFRHIPVKYHFLKTENHFHRLRALCMYKYIFLCKTTMRCNNAPQTIFVCNILSKNFLANQKTWTVCYKNIFQKISGKSSFFKLIHMMYSIIQFVDDNFNGSWACKTKFTKICLMQLKPRKPSDSPSFTINLKSILKPFSGQSWIWNNRDAVLSWQIYWHQNINKCSTPVPWHSRTFHFIRYVSM